MSMLFTSLLQLKEGVKPPSPTPPRPPQASKSHFPYQTSKPREMQGRFLLTGSFISLWISWNEKWALGVIHSSGCSALDRNFQKSDPPSCPCHQRPLPPQLGEPVTKKATDFSSCYLPFLVVFRKSESATLEGVSYSIPCSPSSSFPFS